MLDDKYHYKNPWHDPRNNDSPAFYSTNHEPEIYKGYQIFNRIPGEIGRGIWDIVKDDVCISQYAGPNGARKAIDEIVNESLTNA